MSEITIYQNGTASVYSIETPRKLQHILEQLGIAAEHPCGGRGVCGKCAVKLQGAVSDPTEAEKQAGIRLSCQAEILGDCQVWLPDTQTNLIELSGNSSVKTDGKSTGIGAAIDIGTTTIALKLYDLQSGHELAAAADINPQRAVSADVMGRIDAAVNGQGEYLKQLIENSLQSLLTQAADQVGISVGQIVKMVIAGNTTMLYLLTGRNPDCLGHAPFLADCLFDEMGSLFGIPVYYPRCMDAFVGADITCAVLSSGICQKSDTALLCDIGTNGEIALWKDGKLYVSSTAAGPAFEGAGISCGCGSVPGAIDRVWVEDGEIKVHTIGEKTAVGVCGSGLIDAVAAFLETEEIDETGSAESDQLMLTENVFLLPKDIRAVQLAKAAIAAGIQTLLQSADITFDEIHTLYIAGGFGSHLDVKGAAAIGLIPQQLTDRIAIIGNASLAGATDMLLSEKQYAIGRRLAEDSVHINLGGNPAFNENYMEQMLFPVEY